MRFVTGLILGGATLTAAGCAMDRRLPEAMPAAPMSSAAACVQTTIPVYFQEASDRLTPAAMQALASSTAPLRSCRIREVVVVGLTQGQDNAANRRLSENRALQVTRALAAQGLPSPRIEAFAGGTPGSPEPLQRRTEVTIFPEGS